MTLATEYTVSTLNRDNALLILTLSTTSAKRLIDNLPAVTNNSTHGAYEKAREAAKPYIQDYFPQFMQHPAPEVKLAAMGKAMEYVNLSSFYPGHGTTHSNYPGTAVIHHCMKAVSDSNQAVAETAISLIGTFLNSQSYHPKFIKEGNAERLFQEIQEQVFAAIDKVKSSESSELKRVLVKQAEAIRQAVENSSALGIRQITGANDDKKLLYWALTQSDEAVMDEAISILREREQTEPEKVRKFLFEVIDPRSVYLDLSQDDTRTSSDFMALHSKLSQLDTYQSMRTGVEKHVNSIAPKLP